MKILILSNSEWDDSNSFGSSFSSIFGKIKSVEIANIYCRNGIPNTKTVNCFFNITERSLLNNLLNSKTPSGFHVFIPKEVDIVNNDQNRRVTTFIKQKRWIIFFGFVKLFGILVDGNQKI